MARRMFTVLPGLGLSLGYTLTYLSLMVLIPIVALVLRTAGLTSQQILAAVWTNRAFDAYTLTFGASFLAAAIDTALGLLVAWVLVRYEFPGRRIMDSLIDLPFALPTLVAGLVYSNLYAKNGWLGQFLVPLGFKGAYSQTAIVLVLSFIGLPFVVRTLQPVLESFDAELEEAAACLGANRWQTFIRLLLPGMFPALLTGFALSFARGIGEFGAVVIVSGNFTRTAARLNTEIAPVLIVNQLEDFKYGEAAAISMLLLLVSLTMLGVINTLERWSQSR